MAKQQTSGPVKIDELDRHLLRRLQQNARMTTVELARHLHLSPAGLQKRVRRLEELGVLERYSAIVNRRAVGLELLCFVQVSLAHHRPGSVKRFPHVIATMPEVLECHYLTGEVDYLLKVVVPTHEHLERFVFDRLMKVPGVDRIRTSIALREVKASAPLPL